MRNTMRIRMLLTVSVASAALAAGGIAFAANAGARAPGSQSAPSASSAPGDFLAPLDLTNGRIYGGRGQALPSDTSTHFFHWDFTKWMGLGVSTQSGEGSGLFGRYESGSLPSLQSAKAASVGLSARFGLGAGWVTSFSYNEGIAQLNLRPGNIVDSDENTLHARAYGVSVAKHGLFGSSDALGLSVSRPLELYNGGKSAPQGDTFVNRPLLPGAKPETDVELGYVTTFFDGALALQANAGYQMNAAGKNGQNSVTVLSRAKINF